MYFIDRPRSFKNTFSSLVLGWNSEITASITIMIAIKTSEIFTRKDNVFPVNPMGTNTGKYTLSINSPERNVHSWEHKF